MGLSPQLITEKLSKRAVQRLQHLSKDNREAIRLRAIVAAKEHGMTIVAKIFNVNSNTIRSWAKRFESGDVSNLAYQAGRGRKGKLADEHLATINTWVQDDSSITIAKITSRLKDAFGIESSKSAVHRVLQKLKLSYITPRPVHYKQDKKAQEELKKKS